MKPSITVRLAKVTSILSVALLLTVSAVHATPIKEKLKSATPTDQLVSVSYVGTTDANFVFRIKFDNESAKKFWLIIKNDAGEVVYQQLYKDVHFAKSIFIAKEETSDIHPTFVIRTENEEVERKFSVSRKVSENIEVTKL